MMNGAQAHLLLNHVPVLAVPFSALLLSAGAALRSDELKKAGLAGFVLSALSVLPAYFSGEGAEHVVESLPGVTEALIHAHEEAAEAALAGAAALGVLGLAALWHAARAGRVRRRAWVPLLLAAAVASGLLARAAHLGGLIRHTELLTR